MTIVTEPEGASAVRLTRTGASRVAAVREYGIVVAFAAVFVFLSFRSDVFLTSGNLLNVLEQSAAIGIIACAGTLLLIAGGFDLSVGATFALSGAVAARAAEPLGAPMALLVGVGAGLAVGILNGVLATVGRINPLVATLSSSIVVAGVALIVTKGFLITVDEPGFDKLGQGELLGISYAIYLWIAFAVLCTLALNATTYGRRVFAAGGNPEAARLSGIRVELVRSSTYALSGLAAGLAGVLVASRVSTGQADAGTGLELQVIAAIVVGGTSIWGGQGAVWRTILGVLLLALIDNGFNLLQVDPIYQQILQGTIILAAVALDAWSRQRR